MYKPTHKWLHIEDLEKRWKKYGISSLDIDYYFLTNELKPSVILPLLKLTECEVEPDGNELIIKQIGKIIDSGLYQINSYKNIEWSDSGNGVLSANLCNKFVQFSKFNGSASYYIDADMHLISKSDIVIGAEEIKRFEEKYSSRQDSNICDPVPVNKKDIDYHVPKKTLLKVIAALIEVIIGESSAIPIKTPHPFIKSQKELSSTLADLEEPSLSKSNLDKIFSKANEVKSGVEQSQ